MTSTHRHSDSLHQPGYRAALGDLPEAHSAVAIARSSSYERLRRTSGSLSRSSSTDSNNAARPATQRRSKNQSTTDTSRKRGPSQSSRVDQTLPKRPRRPTPAQALIMQARTLNAGQTTSVESPPVHLATCRSQPSSSNANKNLDCTPRTPKPTHPSNAGMVRTPVPSVSAIQDLRPVPAAYGVARLPTPQQKSIVTRKSPAATTATTVSNRTGQQAHNNTGSSSTECTSNVQDLKPKALLTYDSVLLDEADGRDPPPTHDCPPPSLPLVPGAARGNSLREPHASPQPTGAAVSGPQESCNHRCFIIEAQNSFLALLEEIQWRHSTASSRGTGPDESLPPVARLLELPAEARHGIWKASLHDSEHHSSSETFRISMRHQSHASLGPLESYPPDVPNMASQDDLHVFHPSNSDSFAISRIRPRRTRQLQLETQRTLTRRAKSKSTRLSTEEVFISSLSIVGFEGFSCNYDLNTNGLRRSTKILEGREGSLSQPRTAPSLQNIFSEDKPIGISTVCDLDVKDDYSIYFAQLLSVKGTPIVAIDVCHPSYKNKENRKEKSKRKRYSSTVSQEDPSNLSEENLRAHTESTDSQAYDPVDRFKHDTNFHVYQSANGPAEVFDNTFDLPMAPSSSHNKRFRSSSPMMNDIVTPQTTNRKRNVVSSCSKGSQPRQSEPERRPYKLKFMPRVTSNVPTTSSPQMRPTSFDIPKSPPESPPATQDTPRASNDLSIAHGQQWVMVSTVESPLAMPMRGDTKSDHPVVFRDGQKNNIVTPFSATQDLIQTVRLDCHEENITKRLENVFIEKECAKNETSADHDKFQEDTFCDMDDDQFISCGDERQPETAGLPNLEIGGDPSQRERDAVDYTASRLNNGGPKAHSHRCRAKPFGSSFSLLLLVSLQMLSWMTNRHFEAFQSMPMKKHYAASFSPPSRWDRKVIPSVFDKQVLSSVFSLKHVGQRE